MRMGGWFLRGCGIGGKMIRRLLLLLYDFL